MSRDEFTAATKLFLAMSVGLNCVRPGCAKPTHGVNQQGDRLVNLGVAAHDAAAAPGGPRYDPDQDREQRQAATNGAWLCANCARLVDADQQRYPPGVISQWQINAAQRRMQRSQHPWILNINHASACKAAKEFLSEFVQVAFPWHQLAFPPATEFAVNRVVPYQYRVTDPTDVICSQYPHTVNLQLRMLYALEGLRNEVHNSGVWRYEEVFGYVLGAPSPFRSEQELQFNERVEGSRRRFQGLVAEYHSALNELQSFSVGKLGAVDLYGW